MTAEILRDLARAKAAFQLRSIETVIRGPALAAAAREGGDGTAPAESPQSGGDSRNAQPPEVNP